MGAVANNHVEGAPHQTLLVLDGTTGQNAVSQAKLFWSSRTSKWYCSN